jgi:hypothetical protein
MRKVVRFLVVIGFCRLLTGCSIAQLRWLVLPLGEVPAAITALDVSIMLANEEPGGGAHATIPITSGRVNGARAVVIPFNVPNEYDGPVILTAAAQGSPDTMEPQTIDAAAARPVASPLFAAAQADTAATALCERTIDRVRDDERPREFYACAAAVVAQQPPGEQSQEPEQALAADPDAQQDCRLCRLSVTKRELRTYLDRVRRRAGLTALGEGPSRVFLVARSLDLLTTIGVHRGARINTAVVELSGGQRVDLIGGIVVEPQEAIAMVLGELDRIERITFGIEGESRRLQLIVGR